MGGPINEMHFNIDKCSALRAGKKITPQSNYTLGNKAMTHKYSERFWWACEF